MADVWLVICPEDIFSEIILLLGIFLPLSLSARVHKMHYTYIYLVLFNALFIHIPSFSSNNLDGITLGAFVTVEIV